MKLKIPTILVLFGLLAPMLAQAETGEPSDEAGQSVRQTERIPAKSDAKPIFRALFRDDSSDRCDSPSVPAPRTSSPVAGSPVISSPVVGSPVVGSPVVNTRPIAQGADDSTQSRDSRATGGSTSGGNKAAIISVDELGLGLRGLGLLGRGQSRSIAHHEEIGQQRVSRHDRGEGVDIQFVDPNSIDYREQLTEHGQALTSNDDFEFATPMSVSEDAYIAQLDELEEEARDGLSALDELLDTEIVDADPLISPQDLDDGADLDADLDESPHQHRYGAGHTHSNRRQRDPQYDRYRSMTLNQLLGDDDENDMCDPRKLEICHRMWECAGGRNLSTCDRRKREFWRDHEVLGTCGGSGGPYSVVPCFGFGLFCSGPFGVPMPAICQSRHPRIRCDHCNGVIGCSCGASLGGARPVHGGMLRGIFGKLGGEQLGCCDSDGCDSGCCDDGCCDDGCCDDGCCDGGCCDGGCCDGGGCDSGCSACMGDGFQAG